ncbi:MAG: DNA starvation/stationary phase protection protein [Actinomycetota bacterium]|nr:DNA starvation/stationary phase protection protein [Actinomycetota bacterium]
MDQATALDGALNDLITLAMLAKHAGWNVTGPDFRLLHATLADLANLVGDATDALAERAITLGHHPDGRPETVAAANSLPALESGPLPDHDAVSAFSTILESVISGLHGTLDCFADDRVTEDLLVRIVGPLELHAWMIRAQRR